MDQIKTIELWRHENKRGSIMLLSEYCRIADFIFSAIESKVKRAIDLNELIERARLELAAEFHGNIGWYLLQVKEDLEARRVIKRTLLRKKRLQIIRRNNDSSINAQY